ncbi:MAG: PIN domain-containing protein [Anaerolineae bacterium]
MQVLVDSSIWVDYFRSGANSATLDILIDENLLVTNDIILAELVPFLQVKKQTEIIRLLRAIQKLPLQIDWVEIIQFQTACLQAGVNGVGIPDLLIAQNARQNQCVIYSLDKHFQLIQPIIDIELLETE